MSREQFHIRGQERADLVDDLAQKSLTHAELATKYSRHVQTISQFSARNSSEIAGRRGVLQGELASETTHLWVADKTARIAWYQKMIEDLDGYLADDELDLSVRHRYTREVASMLRAVTEEKGELRSTVEVESAPVLRHIVEGWTPDAWLGVWGQRSRTHLPR
jgi:hypothetical protein